MHWNPSGKPIYLSDPLPPPSPETPGSAHGEDLPDAHHIYRSETEPQALVVVFMLNIIT